jgi:hypothetical protein
MTRVMISIEARNIDKKKVDFPEFPRSNTTGILLV